MSVLSTIAIVVALLLAACTSVDRRATSYPLVNDGAEPGTAYEIVDDAEIELTLAEEDWCTTLEGSAGAWLAADELDLIVDASNGAPATLDQETVTLLEAVESDGLSAISPDDAEQLDTFPEFPTSPLACKAAFTTRNR